MASVRLDADTPFNRGQRLATIVVESPALEPCLGQYFIRFAAGRKLATIDVMSAPCLPKNAEEWKHVRRDGARLM